MKRDDRERGSARKGWEMKGCEKEEIGGWTDKG